MQTPHTFDPAAVLALIDAARQLADHVEALTLAGIYDDEGDPLTLDGLTTLDVRAALDVVDPTGLITQQVRRDQLTAHVIHSAYPPFTKTMYAPGGER